jgi:hypothetical protein
LNERPAKVRPIDLRRTITPVAANYGDKGAVVISVSDDGVRVGIERLAPDELRHALCVVINYFLVFEGEADKNSAG